MNDSNNIKIYTDGSIYPNPGGDGGWAFVRVDIDKVSVTYGYETKKTTSNRMEMMALINALSGLFPYDRATIYTDSEYCVNGYNGWMFGFQKRDFEVANGDLWYQLYELNKSRSLVKVSWIKSHDGNEYNELADRYAAQARIERKSGYEVIQCVTV